MTRLAQFWPVRRNPPSTVVRTEHVLQAVRNHPSGGKSNHGTVKGKVTRYRLGVVQRVGRGLALLFHDYDTRRGGWSPARPGRTLPPGKTRYPLYRRLGGSQGRSGQVRKISPPPGFDLWTVQPVVNHGTVIMIFINCNWVDTRWQWLFYMCAKYDTGYY
jgi:hypothetical protein